MPNPILLNGQYRVVIELNDGYNQILDQISSSNPTPGGGSVSALVLSHAHCLALMVARLTEGNDKWIDGHNAANDIISKSTDGLEKSLELARLDSEAFDEVMKSYRLPRNSDDEKEKRIISIRQSTIRAAKTPLSIVKACSELLESTKELCIEGNINALTDLMSSVELAYSASNIASYNVKINLDSLTEEYSSEISNELESHLKIIKIRFEENISILKERLGW